MPIYYTDNQDINFQITEPSYSIQAVNIGGTTYSIFYGTLNFFALNPNGSFPSNIATILISPSATANNTIYIVSSPTNEMGVPPDYIQITTLSGNMPFRIDDLNSTSTTDVLNIHLLDMDTNSNTSTLNLNIGNSTTTTTISFNSPANLNGSQLNINNPIALLGSLMLQNPTPQITITPPASSIAGTTAGTIYWQMPFGANFKMLVYYFDAYENDTTTNQVIDFAQTFTYAPAVVYNNTGLTLSASTTALTITSPDSTTTYSGWIMIIGW
jgi:hypothetical protein